MRVTRLWVGLVFLAVGVFGILDAAGAVDASITIGGWWPLAIVGWALLEMVDHRRVSLGLLVVLGLGMGLLADEQDWSVRGALWSVLFLTIGGWLLTEAVRHRWDRGSKARESAAGPPVGSDRFPSLHR